MSEKPNPMRDVYQEFPYAMVAVAAVTRYGAEKHEPRDWREFDHQRAFDRYIGKIGRHLLALETNGPVNQEDGGTLHMAAVAWSALAWIDHYCRQQEEEKASSKRQDEVWEEVTDYDPSVT